MIGFNWWKVLPYIAVIATIWALSWYGEHQYERAEQAEQRYAQLQSDIELERAKAEIENQARQAIASEIIQRQAATVQATEAELTKLGITRDKTKKELKNALSQLNTVANTNSLHDNTNVADSVRQAEVAELPSDTENECAATAERLRTIERASIYAVNDYDTCRIALDAIYTQFNEPIKYSDE